MSSLPGPPLESRGGYKIDRLTRSLDLFDRRGVSFIAVTQQINSATSMGRLMLNICCPASSSNAR
jgi:DNA invertase Pin-like site-specific DNA recombinase